MLLAKLNKQAEAIFRKLTEGMRLHDSKIIDDSDVFMKVHLEVIGRKGNSLVISIAHYYEQNGDLVCDPDVTFLTNGSGVYPLTFEQGGVIYQEAAVIEDDGRVRFNQSLQQSITTFCNDWMKNIEAQQF